MKDLPKKIKQAKQAIVAIGLDLGENKMNILGSGFISEGKIITCAHLFNNLSPEQKQNIKANVLTEALDKDLEKYQWLAIREFKKEEKDDIAVFEFSETPPKDLSSIGLTLADSESVEVGQGVYFIGFPYAAQLINDGFGITLVVNQGIVSNIKRDGMNPERKRNWLIVDAISNPGNSGCPVIDLETSEVIGVMSISFRTKSQTNPELDIREPMHIAGAKPINLVKELLK